MAPEETTWKVIDYAWAAIGGLLMMVWNLLNGKIKDNHRTLDARINDCSDEQNIQRSHIGKLFDKMEANSQRSEDRHHELLKAIHEGLSRKADK